MPHMPSIALLACTNRAVPSVMGVTQLKPLASETRSREVTGLILSQSFYGFMNEACVKTASAWQLGQGQDVKFWDQGRRHARAVQAHSSELDNRETVITLLPLCHGFLVDNLQVASLNLESLQPLSTVNPVHIMPGHSVNRLPLSPLTRRNGLNSAQHGVVRAQ
ncbi:hypothetical protein B0J13DRAFT_326165 [Dactylonectria estremocensis]|uniref:Uncharacterized protein n=1 Tax=Dactylonectria estremocensis TaxID=1079267 RepID=A0A9P9EUZ3_9HYPO|nr:hypothetical protein B0J13DRAFT_326165 [Dactylonectria estremocensis]